MFIVYTSESCVHCDSAKELLRTRHQTFEEVNVFEHPEAREKLAQWGVRTVPQIEHNGVYIGGFSELKKYMEEHNEG